MCPSHSFTLNVHLKLHGDKEALFWTRNCFQVLLKAQDYAVNIW